MDLPGEAYEEKKLYKYELNEISNEKKNIIENYFKYFRCFYNNCLTNYLLVDNYNRHEPIPRNIVNSDPIYKYSYEEFELAISPSPRYYNKDKEFMNKEVHNFFRVDNVYVLSTELIKVPKIGFLLCGVNKDLVGKYLDSYIYKKRGKYYIYFMTYKDKDLTKNEISFQTQQLFEKYN